MAGEALPPRVRPRVAAVRSALGRSAALRWVFFGALGLGALAAGLATTAFYTQQRLQQAIEHDFPHLSSSERLASWAIQTHLDELERQVTRLARLQDVKDALRTGSRPELLEQIRPPLNRLRKASLQVTRLTSYGPDGHVFLRAHAPERFGDEALRSRRLVADAFRTRSIVRGLETDEGQLIFWVLTPIYD